MSVYEVVNTFDAGHYVQAAVYLNTGTIPVKKDFGTCVWAQ